MEMMRKMVVGEFIIRIKGDNSFEHTMTPGKEINPLALPVLLRKIANNIEKQIVG